MKQNKWVQTNAHHELSSAGDMISIQRLTFCVLKRSVMALAGADDVTVALQRLEDELQNCFAHIEAVALPDSRQDVQDVASFLRNCRHRTGKQLSTCDKTHRDHVRNRTTANATTHNQKRLSLKTLQ